MSAPGDPRRAEWEQKRTQTHTHTHFHSSVHSNTEILVSQATERIRVGSWPSKSSKLRGETRWEKTSTVPDPRLHRVGAWRSACSASDTEPGRELRCCRKKRDGACQGQSPGSVRVCCCC